MKRRVVKHGPSTLIISIPINWAKTYGIKPGDELEVEEKAGNLIVSSEGGKVLGAIEIDVTGMDRTSIIMFVRNLYRRGYNEIKVNFNKPTAHHFRTGEDINILTIINEEVNRLIGMEIIEQHDNFCIIKEISEGTGKDFDVIMRKIFFQLEITFKDVINALRKNNFYGLSTIEGKHDTIAKFVSYCIRIINQGKIEKSEDSNQLYNILINIDLVTDILKYFSRDVISAKHIFSKKCIDVIEDISNLFTIYSDLQFRFTLEKAIIFQNKRDTIKRYFLKNVTCEKTDLIYINYLSSILEIMKLMTEEILTYNRK